MATSTTNPLPFFFFFFSRRNDEDDGTWDPLFIGLSFPFSLEFVVN